MRAKASCRSFLYTLDGDYAEMSDAFAHSEELLAGNSLADQKAAVSGQDDAFARLNAISTEYPSAPCQAR